jgi:hypothetical protein
MAWCCAFSTSINPAVKAAEYELSILKIEELVEFMESVGLGWPEVSLESPNDAINTAEVYLENETVE